MTEFVDDDSLEDRPGARGGERRRRLKAAFHREERRGLDLAFRLRALALAVIAAFLVAFTPFGEAIYGLLSIGLVLASGLGQWAASRREGYRSWQAYLFVAVDGILIAWIVLSPNPFTDAIQLPAAAHLRGTNFAVVFVILGLTALSYSPGLVLWCGTVTSLALTAIIVKVAARDDVAAGFSNNPLDLAALYDALYDPSYVSLNLWALRILVLMLVAGLLATAVARARGLAVSQAAAEGDRTLLARYFSPNLVEELVQSEAPFASRASRIGVLFADIRGFTAWSADKDPERVIALLRGFHGRMARMVFEHGGTVDKYIGDAVMATFGTPHAGANDARRALACARAMVAEVGEWTAKRTARGDDPVEVGIGVHYGWAVIGNVGDERRLEFTAIGDTVNVASRLEAATRELDADLAVSQALVEAAREQGAGEAELAGFETAGEVNLRGREQPVAVLTYRVRTRETEAQIG